MPGERLHAVQRAIAAARDDQIGVGLPEVVELFEKIWRGCKGVAPVFCYDCAIGLALYQDFDFLLLNHGH